MAATARTRVDMGGPRFEHVIEYLRRMAPAQTHENRREFQEAAELLSHATPSPSRPDVPRRKVRDVPQA